jgi:hypothetical protein
MVERLRRDLDAVMIEIGTVETITTGTDAITVIDLGEVRATTEMIEETIEEAQRISHRKIGIPEQMQLLLDNGEIIGIIIVSSFYFIFFCEIFSKSSVLFYSSVEPADELGPRSQLQQCYPGPSAMVSSLLSGKKMTLDYFAKTKILIFF